MQAMIRTPAPQPMMRCEHLVRRTIPVPRLQRIATLALCRHRQPLRHHRRAADVPASGSPSTAPAAGGHALTFELMTANEGGLYGCRPAKARNIADINRESRDISEALAGKWPATEVVTSAL